MYIKVLSNDDVNKLETSMQNGNWLICYYANWCDHCNKMKPNWEKVTNNMQSFKDLNIADIESDFIQKFEKKPVLEGFPTIKLYINGSVMEDYNGNRETDDIMNFAKLSLQKHYKLQNGGNKNMNKNNKNNNKNNNNNKNKNKNKNNKSKRFSKLHKSKMSRKTNKTQKRK